MDDDWSFAATVIFGILIVAGVIALLMINVRKGDHEKFLLKEKRVEACKSVEDPEARTMCIIFAGGDTRR